MIMRPPKLTLILHDDKEKSQWNLENFHDFSRKTLASRSIPSLIPITGA